MKKIAHPEFANRMQLACDGNPDVPLPNYGRLGWFVTEIEKLTGRTTTIETVRKWFAGESLPRKEMMTALAQALKVDEAWLAIGSEPEISRKEMKVRDATADGVVNVVAGFIAMDGGHPAFPPADDKRKHVDLFAVIKGAQYSFHIVHAAAFGLYHVPVTALDDCIIIGVVRGEGFSIECFELDAERLREEGKRKAGTIEASTTLGWRKITSFAERL